MSYPTSIQSRKADTEFFPATTARYTVSGGRELAGKPRLIVRIDPRYSKNGKPICNDKRCQASVYAAARELHATVLKIYTFYKEVYGLLGTDGEGGVGPFYFQWNKEGYWDCNIKRKTTRFRKFCPWDFNPDCIFNEKIISLIYAHKIVSQVGLNPTSQSEALVHSITACLTAAFEQWRTLEERWELEGIPPMNEHCDMRSLKKGDEDNSQILSQILNRVFRLAVQLTDKVPFGDISHIWLYSFLRMPPEGNLVKFADLMIGVASTDYPQAASVLAYVLAHVGIFNFSPEKALLLHDKAIDQSSTYPKTKPYHQFVLLPPK